MEWVLYFMIVSAVDSREFETGTVTARSCAIAEEWVRAALRPGFRLVVDTCVPAQR